MGNNYEEKLQQETLRFANRAGFVPLPPIFNYWMRTHIVPRFEKVFGKRSLFDLYIDRIAQLAKQRAKFNRNAIVFSIAAGACPVEINLAERLKKAGITNVTFIASDLSDKQLLRAEKQVV